MRGVPLLEVLDNAQGMKIVVKAEAVLAHGGVESAFPRVSKRRMPDVVDQREGLGQVLIQAKRTRNRAGDRRDLESVRQAATEMVGIAVGKNLRLASHASEGTGMGHASAIALEGTAIGMDTLRVRPGGERIVVDTTHRAGGKIYQLQIGIACVA